MRAVNVEEMGGIGRDCRKYMDSAECKKKILKAGMILRIGMVFRSEIVGWSWE
jgi:hypothetical protein